MDVSDLRREYTRAGLTRQMLASDPMEQFATWFAQAREAQILEPNAMVLCTVDADGQPFSRTVLVKRFDRDGLVFYTNFESRKACHIALNPRVSALFLWLPLERQVSFNGIAEKVPTSESLKYFLSRPRGSQLGAWTSKQSSVIRSRALLEGKLQEMKQKFRDGQIPLPSFWGGYRLRPHSVEFWQGRENRLHDRFLYQRGAEGWEVNRLAP